jgi:hypothetical protein
MSDDTQTENVVDETINAQFDEEVECPHKRCCQSEPCTGPSDSVDGALSLAEDAIDELDDDVTAALKTLAAEVRRLREMSLDACEAETRAKNDRLQADRDQLSASNLRLVAENERLRVELERRNVAHVEPAILTVDRDEWKARALSAERGANVLTRKLTAISNLLEMQHDESLIAVGDVRRALFDTK